jgi:tetratricopeptide (TPR) repeat protein
VIADDISLQLLGVVWGKELRVVEADEPYRTNPVTKHILAVFNEKGTAYFKANSDAILKEAGFDFENDMQLLGVGEQLIEAQQWESGIALYDVYTTLFPRIVVAWNHLGRCKKAVGDIAGAKSAWQKSVGLRPQNNPAVKWLQELE